MAPLTRLLRATGRLWLTGALYILAGLGYCFYGLLFLYRLMQTNAKVLAVVVLLLLCAGGGAAWWLMPRPAGPALDLVMAEGQSLRSFTDTLAARGVVPSSRVLRLWLKLSGRDRSVQAGRYSFVAGEGILAAGRALEHATPIELVATVPEGLVVEQIAAIVAAAFHVDSAQFARICLDPATAGRCGIQGLSLEGYLFPDTYRFAPGVTAAQVVDRMVARFGEEYGRLQRDSLLAAQLSQAELVTLASIVEKEAQVPAERARIAGVFHNRLRAGIPLGADPTVRYMLHKFSGPLRVSELTRDDPYNTRVRKGLPPGPICSPGFAAMQAAAVPLQTRELYFVARWDGSGAHDFSCSLSEHERRKLEIRRRNEQRIRRMTQAQRDSAAADGAGE